MKRTKSFLKPLVKKLMRLSYSYKIVLKPPFELLLNVKLFVERLSELLFIIPSGFFNDSRNTQNDVQN
jgi:hypothetical protein